MLALSMLPLACFADRPVTARMTVGVFQDFAPSPHHMQHVLLPLLERMGVAMELQVIRAGYVPRGRGTIELFVRPAKHSLHTLTLTELGSWSHGAAKRESLRQTLDQSASEPKAGEVLLEASRIAPITPVDASNAKHTEAVWARGQDRPREVYSRHRCVDFSQDIGLLRRSKGALNTVEAAHQRRREALKKSQEDPSSRDEDHRVPQTSLEVQRLGLFGARLFPKATHAVDLCVPRLADRSSKLNPSVLDLRCAWFDPEQDWILRMAAHERSGVLDEAMNGSSSRMKWSEGRMITMASGSRWWTCRRGSKMPGAVSRL